MLFLRMRLFKEKSFQDGISSTILSAILIVCLSVFNAAVCQADDVITLEEVNNVIASAAEDAAEESAKGKPVESKPDSSSGTTVTNTSMPSDGAIFVGLGVAGLAALALALGTGGSEDNSTPAVSSSSSPPSPSPSPPSTPEKVDPVGPSIAGTWSGRLVLINHGSELVTATVVQNGTDVQITTSTTLPYGKYFSGTISSYGSMYMYDGTTGQIWTTHGGNATANRIGLFDYVNDFKELDSLELNR